MTKSGGAGVTVQLGDVVEPAVVLAKAAGLTLQQFLVIVCETWDRVEVTVKVPDQSKH